MKRLLITMLFMLTMNAALHAQQMIPKQIGLELSYSVFPGSPQKLNYVLATGLVSYQKNGNYLFGLVEYNRKYNEYRDYDIPIDTFLLNAGYSFYLGGDLMRNVNLTLSVSGLAGYEQVNKGKAILYDGSQLDSAERFVYGAGSKLSLESYLTEHLVFSVNGQLRFLQNTHLGVLPFLFGCGLRYNF